MRMVWRLSPVLGGNLKSRAGDRRATRFVRSPLTKHAQYNPVLSFSAADYGLGWWLVLAWECYTVVRAQVTIKMYTYLDITGQFERLGSPHYSGPPADPQTYIRRISVDTWGCDSTVGRQYLLFSLWVIGYFSIVFIFQVKAARSIYNKFRSQPAGVRSRGGYPLGLYKVVCMYCYCTVMCLYTL